MQKNFKNLNACQQVENLVQVELAYINTKHPDFSEAHLVHRAMTSGGLGIDPDSQRSNQQQQQKNMLQEKEEREKVGDQRHGHFLVEESGQEKISSSSGKDSAVMRTGAVLFLFCCLILTIIVWLLQCGLKAKAEVLWLLLLHIFFL